MIKQLRHKKRHSNIRIGIVLMIVPLAFGILAGAFIFDSRYQAILSAAGADRLTTKNWQTANAAFKANEPVYQRQFAYYRVLPGQTMATLAAHFGVPVTTLTTLNPGAIVAGTTIKVPPVAQPLTPFNGTGSNLSDLSVQLNQGVLYVSNNTVTNPQVDVTIPALMQLLAPYKAIVQTGPKDYRLLVPLFIEGNVRLDITGDTVSKLELKSDKNYQIVTLTLKDAEALIENTSITTVDLATGKPDTNYTDGRSFVRAYGDSRMDVINSSMSYLGTDLAQIRDKSVTQKVPFVTEGGIYGISWRIPTGTFGQDVVTGWVQNSNFQNNYIGSFTFGASGMTWENNYFAHNTLYGLDPHDDSNNALIEHNTFAYNDKHGFIVSKRCDYNIIENNVSYGNHLHGFMLHMNSAYNLIEHNVAYDNTDNYVIYQSNYNEIKDNVGYDAHDSEVRINANAADNYVQGNTLIGGERGIYLYDGTRNTLVNGNNIQKVKTLLTDQNAQVTLFEDNQIPTLTFKLDPGDRVIFGKNQISHMGATQIKQIESPSAITKNTVLSTKPGTSRV